MALAVKDRPFGHIALHAGPLSPVLSAMFREAAHAVIWARRHRTSRMPAPEFEHIRQFLRPDDVAFDVGAHAGSWTAQLAKSLPKGHVYAFEALPYYARTLRWTAILLRWKNVTVLNNAVVDVPQVVNLVWKDNSGMRLTGKTHVRGAGDEAPASVSVRGITLDEVLLRTPTERVRFVKCDVEGFELSVLRGSLGLIGKCRPFFWCELWAEYTSRYDYSPGDVLRFFTELNYNTYVLKDDRLVRWSDAAAYAGRGDILAAPAEFDVFSSVSAADA